jgi:uncharacterized protein YecE (DUF72 family)
MSRSEIRVSGILSSVKPVRIGCSGWNYRDWRGRLYPEREPQRRWLELYAERFDTVEINATFYRLPTRDAVARWVEQTPTRFEFTVKVSRYLTHIKRLTDVDNGMALFYERIEPMVTAGRLGPLLWQLPENFHRDDERLARWLEALPAGRHAIEFRHASWFEEPVFAALSDHDVALVVGDHPKRPFQLQVPTTSWWFVRFHHGRRGRGGNYSATELASWGERVRQWRREREVYAYFNNDWKGYAPANALALRRLVEGR